MTQAFGRHLGFTPDGLKPVGLDGDLRSAESMTVLHLRILEGKGTEENPYRNVSYWIIPREEAHGGADLLLRYDPAEGGGSE